MRIDLLKIGHLADTLIFARYDTGTFENITGTGYCSKEVSLTSLTAQQRFNKTSN
jgi:hypothetical protein